MWAKADIIILGLQPDGQQRVRSRHEESAVGLQ